MNGEEITLFNLLKQSLKEEKKLREDYEKGAFKKSRATFYRALAKNKTNRDFILVRISNLD